MYFDHRNYLPSIGIVLLLVAGLYQLIVWVQNKSSRWLLITLLTGCMLLLANLVWVLSHETRLWQNQTAFTLGQL